MKTIYILEDSKIVAELLKFDLQEDFNCKVRCFENSVDLFDDILLNKAKKPDLIILDHFIDNQLNENGLNILKKIKRYDGDIPVIMFSGQHSLQLAVELIHAGAADYIDKNEDSFLEDMNNSVRSLFKYYDTVNRLSVAREQARVDQKQVIGLAVLSFIFLVSLITLQQIVS